MPEGNNEYKNRRNISKINNFSLQYTHYITESLMFRNRLLFIY